MRHILSYIKIFYDCLDIIEPLDEAERGRLFTALLQYARNGQVPALEGNERFLFPALRAQLDRDAACYEHMCQVNRENGSRGGRPRKNPPGFSETEKSQDEDKEKDEDKDKEKERKREYKDSSSGGASGTAGRKKSPYRGFRPSKVSGPEQIRQDMAAMETYRLQLRKELEKEAPQPP